jgi:hypothetical protein
MRYSAKPVQCCFGSIPQDVRIDLLKIACVFWFFLNELTEERIIHSGGGEMRIKLFFILEVTALVLMCLSGGCTDDSLTCTNVYCSDRLTVKIYPDKSFVSGRYSAELVFLDDVSIVAEFELVPADGGTGVVVRVIENESYSQSWFMPDDFEDFLEITYWGDIPDDSSARGYEFTDELTINITRDDALIFSDYIAPDYDYYWCNREYGRCDPRQNKRAEIEVIID